MDYRQQMGCGYEPATEKPPLVWHPAFWLKHGIKATACAGYTTRLPEVQDVIGAYAHWEAGTLREYLDGEEPTRPLLEGLAAFKAGLNEYERSKFPGGN